MSFDWNSFISAIVGGLIALGATWLTLRTTKKQKKEDECRNLLPLFYYLSSKVALIMALKNHSELVPIEKIVIETELSDVVNRLGYASRVLSISEIGEINSFCRYLRKLETSRSDCLKATNSMQKQEMNIYIEILDEADSYLKKDNNNSGIYEIEKKLEYYFSKVLTDAYKGTQIK